MTNTFYTPTTLAHLYQLPRTTIWKLLRNGEFKGALKIGKHYRIPHEARLAFEKRHLKGNERKA